MITIFLVMTLGAAPGSGQCAFSGGAPEQAARLRAVESVLDDMLFLVRPLARSKVLQATRVAAWVQISQTAAGWSVQFEGRDAMVAPADDTPNPWKSPTGEWMEVHHRMEGARLVQRVVAPDGGQRRNVFTFGQDGAVLVDITVTNPKLPRPITYQLTYRCSVEKTP